MVDEERFAEIVARLRRQGADDASVEAKACGTSLTKDVWETVSGFANTAGGLIVCGLDERVGFRAVNDFDLGRVRDQFVTGIGDGGQPALLTHVPRYELSRSFVDGHQVLLIEISELSPAEKPCYITARGMLGGSFKRVDDKDIKLSPTELYEMQTVMVPSDADGSIVPEATAEDLDASIVDSILEVRGQRSPRSLRGALSRGQQLDRLNLTNKSGGVRLAGLLAAGLYPQQYYPKLVVDVAVHPGIEKSEPGGPRFLDRQVCDGPLSVCIETALAAIGRNLRKASYVTGAGRHDEWEIPQEVLREALANAVIHREYAPLFLGQAVSVDIYPDRVEIGNPGGLWGGKTVESLYDGESRCRNSRLMSLMEAVPLPYGRGFVAESQGSGILAMVREMRSRALAAPKFIAKPDSFKVVLGRHGVELEETHAWIKARTRRPLTRSEETLLAFSHEAGDKVTVSSARNGLGWDSDDIRDVCGTLERDGLLRQTRRDEYVVTNHPSSTRDSSANKKRSAASLRDALLASIEPGREYRARELSLVLGEPVSRIRYALSTLVEQGFLTPTAGPRNKNRTYMLARGK